MTSVAEYTKAHMSRRDAERWFHAQGLKISSGYLANLASTGNGPRYVKFGRRAMYRPGDLQEWVEARSTIKG